jgi:hypothetical protein
VSCSGSKRWGILPYLKIAEPKDALILCTFCTPLNCNGSMVFFFFIFLFSALREKRLWTSTWRNQFPEQASWAKTQLYRWIPLDWQNENWHKHLQEGWTKCGLLAVWNWIWLPSEALDDSKCPYSMIKKKQGARVLHIVSYYNKKPLMFVINRLQVSLYFKTLQDTVIQLGFGMNSVCVNCWVFPFFVLKISI